MHLTAQIGLKITRNRPTKVSFNCIRPMSSKFLFLHQFLIVRSMNYLPLFFLVLEIPACTLLRHQLYGRNVTSEYHRPQQNVTQSCQTLVTNSKDHCHASKLAATHLNNAYHLALPVRFLR